MSPETQDTFSLAPLQLCTPVHSFAWILIPGNAHRSGREGISNHATKYEPKLLFAGLREYHSMHTDE